MRASEPISWSTAQRVGARVSGREPFSLSYLSTSLERDFAELTHQAEALVEKETGLSSQVGPARVRVTDRIGWVDANLASFRRLLSPLTDRLTQKIAARPSRFTGVTQTVVGAQVGVLLGWMSTRVLGQYDLLLLEDERPEDQDIVYYVGPNVLALEKRYAFPPREFRLWLALHECTHRAQFTGVSWLTDHFREQVHGLLEGLDPDPKRVTQALRRSLDDVRAGDNPLADGGLLALLATPDQRAILRRIYGLMALLEGHGDVTMSRAGSDLIPNAERFHRVLHERRSNQRGIARVMQRVLGIDAKLRQYEEGEKFIKAIESAGGQGLVRRVWEGSEYLPDYDEIREPQKWIDRVEKTGSTQGISGTQGNAVTS